MSNNQAVYKRLAEGADSDMMKSDNLLFSPSEMIAGSGLSHQEIDPSYRRFAQEQMKPMWTCIGGLILFLIAVKYLTSPK